MVKIKSAAPIDGAAVLPDVLVDQYVKPGGDQLLLLDAYRTTALDWVERHTTHSITRRRWIATFDRLDCVQPLPRCPVQSIVTVSYIDAAGSLIDVTAQWRLDDDQLRPAGGGRWLSDSAVTVTFEAGYDNVIVEAPALRVAALLLMKHLFDGGSIDDVPATVSLLLDGQYHTPVMA